MFPWDDSGIGLRLLARLAQARVSGARSSDSLVTTIHVGSLTATRNSVGSNGLVELRR